MALVLLTDDAGADTIQGLGRHFRILDDSGDRNIDEREFGKAIREYGFNISDEVSSNSVCLVFTRTLIESLGVEGFDEGCRQRRQRIYWYGGSSSLSHTAYPLLPSPDYEEFLRVVRVRNFCLFASVSCECLLCVLSEPPLVYRAK